jgi:CBS domain containing-hemolysin-like protein
LLLSRFGRIPDPGEAVDIRGWRLEAMEVKGRAITRVRLRRLPSASNR